ncbi:hypothetical protein MRB53_039817 [Persea americana]|nr:hypothetical protein MRB53_039817 [Persea americana]
MSADYTFKGWVAEGPEAVEGKMVWKEYTPKQWTEDDVDIQITHAGICGSDCHTLRSGWAPTLYPALVGHEIVGKAVRVGSNVKHIKKGSRVGVGAQAWGCMNRTMIALPAPAARRTTARSRSIRSYNGKWPNGDKSYGGYALYNRTPGNFVFNIPEAIPSEEAAPMLCGGVTVFRPLRYERLRSRQDGRHRRLRRPGSLRRPLRQGAGREQGRGHQPQQQQKGDALKMGADQYIATDEDADWAQEERRHHRPHRLDNLLAQDAAQQVPAAAQAARAVHPGRRARGQPAAVQRLCVDLKGAKIGGSAIGSIKDINDMLALAAEKGVHPWIVQEKMEDANKTVVDMDKGLARYRYVLVNGEAATKL